MMETEAKSQKESFQHNQRALQEEIGILKQDLALFAEENENLKTAEKSLKHDLMAMN